MHDIELFKSTIKFETAENVLYNDVCLSESNTPSRELFPCIL